MQSMKHITKDMIKNDLRALGLREGDTVLFHSSMKSIGYIEGGADAVLDAFLEVTGPSGTLALPGLSMYDFNNMDMDAILREWDIEDTPTFTGTIPETFRKRPTTLRSNNATHSVTAFGKNAEYIIRDHANAYGAETSTGRPHWASPGAFGIDSPWDRLYDLDAKIMLIGVGFNYCTMIHHVQVMYWELFIGRNNPAAPWPLLDFLKMGERLERLGIVQMGHIGASETRIIGSRVLVDAALEVMATGGP